jgi:NAD(P)-dependent dehydrogenase (short-subunit alcohol dehydrogenase family)
MHGGAHDREWAGLDCVVTGGTGALGRAVVARLLAGGATVHVPWWHERELADFPFADRVRLAKVDLGDEGAVESYFRALPALYASIQTAGGFAMAPVVETSGAAFEQLWRLNTLTAFLTAREAVRTMRRSPQFASRGGRIVLVAARPVARPVGGMVAYAASKAAVLSLAESLAEELAAERILVNAILPSIMDTPANRAAMPDADHARWPKVEEVAETIAFLASPRNAVTSGAGVPVYGRG